MRIQTILLLSIIIFSCGESSNKSSLIAGVYDAKVELKSATDDATNFATGMLAMAEIEMKFTADSLYYTMSMGAITKTTPWLVEYNGDSLKIIKKDKTESYFINNLSASKIELIAAEQKLILTKK